MRRIVTLITVLGIIAFSVIVQADTLTDAQRSWRAGIFHWGLQPDLVQPVNVHGDAIIAASGYINFIEGRSTSNGKWFHFIIGNASTTATTIPIDVDGYSRAVITQRVLNQRSSVDISDVTSGYFLGLNNPVSATCTVWSDALQLGKWVKANISVLPTTRFDPNFADSYVSNIAKANSIVIFDVTGVPSCKLSSSYFSSSGGATMANTATFYGTSQDGFPAIMQGIGVMDVNLGGAKSLIISVSDQLYSNLSQNDRMTSGTAYFGPGGTGTGWISGVTSEIMVGLSK